MILRATHHLHYPDIGDRTALRDLKDLKDRGLMVKTGKLKGTRYYLNVPYPVERLRLN